MKRIAIIITLLISLAYSASAQNGCVIYYGGGSYGNVVYTTTSSGTSSCNGYTVQNYSSSNKVTLTKCLKPPSPDNYRQCVVNGSCGVLVQNYTVACPIDDDAFLLCGAVCLFAVLGIKRIK